MLFASDLPDGFVSLGMMHHQPLLVLLSYVIATAAGYTALSMATLASSSALNKNQTLWRLIGGLSLGSGIWSMHFVSMLSYEGPVPLYYNYGLTAVSLVIAMTVSYVVICLVSREYLSPGEYSLASILAGVGIAAMHYTGMYAIESVAKQVYDPGLFVASIVVAILASLGALILAFVLRNMTGRYTGWLYAGASLILGGAIVSMHFTGMAALTLVVPEGTPSLTPTSNEHGLLIIAITVLTLLIICSSLAAMWLEKRFNEQKSQLARKESGALNQVALRDPLTHLLNDYSFEQFLVRTLNRAQSNEQFALFNLDLDHFKRINDSLGLSAGDDLLIQVARRVSEILPDHSEMTRQGDEFRILAPLSDPSDSETLSLRLLEQLRPPFNLSGQQIGMTSSIGIAHFPEDAQTASELLKNAGLAVGHCKQNGRNRFLRFTPDLQRRAEELLHLEQDLRQALAEGGLEVHYQPIVSSDAQQVIGLEALVRWRHPTLGPVSPDRFVHVAEQSGQIGELDGWVMRRACQDLKILHDLGHTQLRVAVNCSPLNLTNRGLLASVEGALRQAGLPARALTLELTENALMHNLNIAIELLERIRTLGVKVSIDDFGSGYSSLAYLSKLRVDTLKVDRAFVRDIPGQQTDMDITAAIIAMAHKLQLKVVAEGVETPEQLAFLRENQCDYIQGYFFSKPLALLPLQVWLSKFEKAADMASQSQHLPV
ncbi:diguanylate cyclase (GGDEF)-like protein [Pseudomonas duriflava]|uniref:Diguanylate cyclase (GGDEF)-like protein n=1 Tax=Pseudomonas duriflava TaxID=459528 RepID=A0A562QKS4_9PSED|nr:bifunctional diguanylate cyclase/phosphodiesterase [Pseudomonas duriflava]TWI57341.1 diguanylate cyclase (GGDEF)-like protein [Pseudomonas duriflava]